MTPARIHAHHECETGGVLLLKVFGSTEMAKISMKDGSTTLQGHFKPTANLRTEPIVREKLLHPFAKCAGHC